MVIFGSTTGVFIISLAIIFVVLFLYIRRKKYTTRSKEVSVFVDIMTILIGIASILATLVSIDVMRSQEKLQEILLDLQKKENQPVFYIKQQLTKSAPDGVYDIEDYSIENIGGYMLSPAKIEHYTMISVYCRDYSKTEAEGVRIYYPVNYYNGGIDYKNISGLLYKTIGGEYLKNNLCLNNIYKAFIEYDKNNNVYTELNKIELFKISYIDIYGENKEIYYRDSQQINKDIYDEIMNERKKYLFQTKSIDKLTLDDILKVINEKK